MAWFKVDDGFHHSAKVLSIPRDIRAEALGLWILAGTWSADNRTDGFIPKAVLIDWPISQEAVDALIQSGLWIRNDQGAQFHDWCDYQPTREQLEAKSAEISAKRSAAGSKGAANRWQADSKPMAKDSPVPVPVPVPNKNSSPSKLDGYFDSFWSLYPRKVGKESARKAFLKAAKKTNPQTIVDCTENFAKDPNLPFPEFIPHPATWLNRGGWEDEPYPGSAPTTKAFTTPSLPQPPTKEELEKSLCKIHKGYPLPCDRCEIGE